MIHCMIMLLTVVLSLHTLMLLQSSWRTGICIEQLREIGTIKR